MIAATIAVKPLMNKPETPTLAVDIVIEIDGNIVLIERKNKPYGWALPGGFVDIGETCMDAAIREAEEETGLKIKNIIEGGMYDAPERDPRGHTVSITYYANAYGIPIGTDDAKNAIVINPQDALDQYYNNTLVLCFDHKQIIQDYLDSLKNNEI